MQRRKTKTHNYYTIPWKIPDATACIVRTAVLYSKKYLPLPRGGKFLWFVWVGKMEKLITVLEIIVPIAVTVLLGVAARRRGSISPAGVDGLQQFIIRFALPCVLFNSCLTSDFGAETLTSMALLLPLLLVGTLIAFRKRRRGGYSNLPIVFAAQESGMLGIPLYLVLFGQAQVYRIAALDVTQALVAVPVISILAAGSEARLSVGQLARKVAASPLLIAGVLGLALNLSGALELLEELGVAGILTDTTAFLATPVSAVILFTIGYNFSLTGQARAAVAAVSAAHLAVFALYCLVIQGAFFLLPDVAAESRWAVLLYCMLPPSFLTPSLGRSQEEQVFGSGVCSVRTLVTLGVFCLMAVFAR